jgi:hypothetical protein
MNLLATTNINMPILWTLSKTLSTLKNVNCRTKDTYGAEWWSNFWDESLQCATVESCVKGLTNITHQSGAYFESWKTSPTT